MLLQKNIHLYIFIYIYVIYLFYIAFEYKTYAIVYVLVIFKI